MQKTCQYLQPPHTCGLQDINEAQFSNNLWISINALCWYYRNNCWESWIHNAGCLNLIAKLWLRGTYKISEAGWEGASVQLLFVMRRCKSAYPEGWHLHRLSIENTFTNSAFTPGSTGDSDWDFIWGHFFVVCLMLSTVKSSPVHIIFIRQMRCSSCRNCW